MFISFVLNLLQHIMSSHKDDLTNQFISSKAQGVSLMSIIKKYSLYIIAGVAVVVITLHLVSKAVDRYESLVATENSYKTLIAQVQANEEQNKIKDNINNINLNSISNTIDIIESKNNNVTSIDNIFNNINKPLIENTEIKEPIVDVKEKPITKPKSIQSNKKLVINTLAQLSNSIDHQIESLPTL